MVSLIRRRPSPCMPQSSVMGTELAARNSVWTSSLWTGGEFRCLASRHTFIQAMRCIIIYGLKFIDTRRMHTKISSQTVIFGLKMARFLGTFCFHSNLSCCEVLLTRSECIPRYCPKQSFLTKNYLFPPMMAILDFCTKVKKYNLFASKSPLIPILVKPNLVGMRN